MINWFRKPSFTSLTESIWSFSFEAYKQLSHAENLVFSPLGLYFGLSILHEGARGNTRRKVANLLHQNEKRSLLPDLSVLLGELRSRAKLSEEDLRHLDELERERAELIAKGMSEDLLAYMVDSVTAENYGISLDIDSGLWIQDSYLINQKFKQKVRAHLKSTIENLDFTNAPDKACEAINSWIRERTRNQKKQTLSSIDLPPLLRMVLVTAIYFRGKWESKFSEPEPGPFYLHDGTQIETQMMKKMSLSHRFVQSKQCWAVELPYADRPLAMILIVPTSKDRSAFLKLEQNLSEIRGKLKFVEPKRQEIHITMPEFRIKIRKDVSIDLSNMGLSEIFVPTANFTAISSEAGLHINSLIHDASIDVDRYGTVATSFTLAWLVGYKRTDEKQIYLTADHPFYFEIIDQPTRVPIFMGKVMNPNL
jgi:serpin B